MPNSPAFLWMHAPWLSKLDVLRAHLSGADVGFKPFALQGEAQGCEFPTNYGLSHWRRGLWWDCVSVSLHFLIQVFFLICLICRSVLPSSWVSFTGSVSICNCRLDLSMAGGELKIFLHHHLGLEPQGVSCTHQLSFNSYHLLARILSSILPPAPFVIISEQTSDIFTHFITRKRIETGVKAKFFVNLGFLYVKNYFIQLSQQ